jgi:hypothetical protein
MQGRGVANYSTEKPNHSFSTKTTEFDDALLKRNIITFEQAMMAKGASPAEAARLALLKNEQDRALIEGKIDYGKDSQRTSKEDADDSDQDSTEGLRAEYRSKRLVQLKYGHVIPISRTEWNREVNDSSHDQWVVIMLTSTSSAPNVNPYHREICQKIEQDIIPYLAGKFSEVKWVSIPSKGAIENWPDENLPTLFCYHKGKLQYQLVGVDDFGIEVTCDHVEYKLGKLGVIESDIEINPEELNRQGRSNQDSTTNNSYGRSKFLGGMATLATTNDEDLSDYDDVD